MPERQHHANIANEMAGRLQRSATSRAGIKANGKPSMNGPDHEVTFAQAIRRLIELGLSSGKRSK